MTVILLALSALGYGVVSALVPVVNAEAYAVSAGTIQTAGLVLTVVGLAVGQTAGKLVLFQAARTGSGRLHRRSADGHGGAGGRASRWMGRLRPVMASRRTGLPLVFASASVGLPPLLAVSVAAGAAGQGRCGFALSCVTGRSLRFGVLALPLALAS